MQLHELKKEFEKCKHDLMRLHHLLERREIEMNMMHELKFSIENELIRVKKAAKTDPNQAKHIKDLMDKHAEQIASLKQSVKMIDSEIDAIGEEKEQECARLKQRLIDGVLLQHPESTHAFADIEKQTQEANNQIERIDTDTQLLHPLFKVIQEGTAINSKISLLGFLLGKTPRAQLARIADQTAELAEKTLSACQEDNIKLFLQMCIQKTKNPWSQHFNSDSFISLHHESLQLMQSIEKAKQKELKKVLDQEKAFEAWLTKYCQFGLIEN